MNDSRPIVYYVTAHGYGHGVRSHDIISAAAERFPEWRWIIVSDLPEDFVRSRYRGIDYELRAGAFDVGMVQKDSIRVDVAATLERLNALHERREELLDRERKFLKERNAGLVVVDVPALPLRAAREVGVPALAVSNFTWDWIYEPFLDEDSAWAA
ncbi:MAG: glycosyl transferase, partial [Verrucomicrobiota bacterium]